MRRRRWSCCWSWLWKRQPFFFWKWNNLNCNNIPDMQVGDGFNSMPDIIMTFDAMAYDGRHPLFPPTEWIGLNMATATTQWRQKASGTGHLIIADIHFKHGYLFIKPCPIWPTGISPHTAPLSVQLLYPDWIVLCSHNKTASACQSNYLAIHQQ